MSLLGKVPIGISCLKYKLFKTRTPLLVSLSVTGRCNLKCPYCYINVYNREPVDLSFEKLCKYIDDFYELGTRIFFLQGGEPMVRKDIVDLVGYIKKKGCYASISTNGTISEHIVKLKGLIDHIEFSLDGPPEVTDRSRGKGVYDKVIHSANVAKENGIKFHLHSVLNIYNCEEEQIKAMARLATGYGTYFTACFATSSGYENNQEFIGMIPDDKQKEIYRLLIRLKKEGYPVGVTDYALNHALNWPIRHNEIGFSDNLPKDYRNRCSHGRLTAWFDHEGWLYPCTLAFGREEFRENVNELGIKEAWRRLEKLKCVDCGVASDITSLFDLKLESIINAFKKY